MKVEKCLCSGVYIKEVLHITIPGTNLKGRGNLVPGD